MNIDLKTFLICLLVFISGVIFGAAWTADVTINLNSFLDVVICLSAAVTAAATLFITYYSRQALTSWKKQLLYDNAKSRFDETLEAYGIYFDKLIELNKEHNQLPSVVPNNIQEAHENYSLAWKRMLKIDSLCPSSDFFEKFSPQVTETSALINEFVDMSSPTDVSIGQKLLTKKYAGITSFKQLKSRIY
ncbi:hypothetical protein Q4601_09015 [Shewanella sp. 1_MG-2023]|uniref:hypothetical protein n=1 Tax=unclassified Shewanella TaxID=196818 RepID=UPI0026E27DC5|nr:MULTISPECIES: hypothetical protein [unclassified Shewanella]MDO6610433.1 hypothetical protein [Shewanella sp. 7_MG-2023]MDO6770558.1 hypothetical protein [Shewanella sp. 2_MG-2023]MDO6794445.1 hypothetical protein [Shewanella sp. 1_MG-2023]